MAIKRANTKIQKGCICELHKKDLASKPSSGQNKHISYYIPGQDHDNIRVENEFNEKSIFKS